MARETGGGGPLLPAKTRRVEASFIKGSDVGDTENPERIDDMHFEGAIEDLEKCLRELEISEHLDAGVDKDEAIRKAHTIIVTALAVLASQERKGFREIERATAHIHEKPAFWEGLFNPKKRRIYREALATYERMVKECVEIRKRRFLLEGISQDLDEKIAERLGETQPKFLENAKRQAYLKKWIGDSHKSEIVKIRGRLQGRGETDVVDDAISEVVAREVKKFRVDAWIASETNVRGQQYIVRNIQSFLDKFDEARRRKIIELERLEKKQRKELEDYKRSLLAADLTEKHEE